MARLHVGREGGLLRPVPEADREGRAEALLRALPRPHERRAAARLWRRGSVAAPGARRGPDRDGDLDGPGAAAAPRHDDRLGTAVADVRARCSVRLPGLRCAGEGLRVQHRRRPVHGLQVADDVEPARTRRPPLQRPRDVVRRPRRPVAGELSLDGVRRPDAQRTTSGAPATPGGQAQAEAEAEERAAADHRRVTDSVILPAVLLAVALAAAVESLRCLSEHLLASAFVYALAAAALAAWAGKVALDAI